MSSSEGAAYSAAAPHAAGPAALVAAQTEDEKMVAKYQHPAGYGATGDAASLEEGSEPGTPEAPLPPRCSSRISSNGRCFPFREDFLEWESWGTSFVILAFVAMQLVVNVLPLLILRQTVLLDYSLAAGDQQLVLECSAQSLSQKMQGTRFWGSLSQYVSHGWQVNTMLVTCEVTRIFLQSMPGVATCTLLVVVLRLALQMRIYYVLLKNGGILDFRFNFGFRDPLVVAVCSCILLGVAHFALRNFIDWQGQWNLKDLKQHVESQQHEVQLVWVPVVIFLYCLRNAFAVKNFLIPLSNYFEADPAYARSALGSLEFMKELSTRRLVLTCDFVGRASEPTMHRAVRELVHAASRDESELRTRRRECHATTSFSNFGRIGEDNDRKAPSVSWDEELVSSMWPARLLLDWRVADEASTYFRKGFCIIAVICVLGILGLLRASIMYIGVMFMSARAEGRWQLYWSAGAQCIVAFYQLYLLDSLRRGLCHRTYED